MAAIAERLGARAHVAIRVNPDVDAGSHPHISTGRHTTKFGIPPAEVHTALRLAAGAHGLRVVGLHVHIGSQITSVEPFERAVGIVAALAREAAADGIGLEHVDVGGGLGIAYRPGERVVSLDQYASVMRRLADETGLALVLEPGRWIVGPAGTLVAQVVDVKPRADGGWFVVVDAGMTELMRPALYGAFHRITVLTPRSGPPIRADVVGPVCETADTLGADRELPQVQPGDLIAVHDTGAYGAVMSSNYNRRPAAAEVLSDSSGWRVIRRRQTLDDMLQWDA
jgi:diaminopimelate decarboxylase